MTEANGTNDSGRPDDDSHEHIVSGAPSGVATPQPDLSDRRLPGIMHSYFGQVRAQSTTAFNASGLPTHTPPPSNPQHADHTIRQHARCRSLGNALPTAPNSPGGLSMDGDEQSPPLLPHERHWSSQQEPTRCPLKRSLYPTPPASSPSSLNPKDTDDKPGARSGRHSEDRPTVSRPAFGRHQSATAIIPHSTLLHTATAKSLSGITTNASVHAAHISNPTSLHSSTVPNSPTHDKYKLSALSSLSSSYVELSKLTEGVAISSRQKTTPPYTPRALSNDTPETAKKGQSSAPQTSNPPHAASSTPESLSAGNERQNSSTESQSRTRSVSHSTPPVGPPKGKLAVKISEARGLRPSYDPYVVCVFEWNEYISRGPKRDDQDSEKDTKKSIDDLFGGLPMKRPGSDMGRSIAIPMKSRQSSTTSLSDQKNFNSGRQVTDPKWEHEAML